MEDKDILCKCKRPECLGYITLHNKEMFNSTSYQDQLKLRYGDIEFIIENSPGSGEVFTQFYDMHLLQKKE